MNDAATRAKALAYFVGMGWTPAQAAGIVANLVAESGLNPAAVGDGGQAYGIAQWHPDRQAGFAALMGKPIQDSTLEDQLAWVHAELQGTEKSAGDALRSCTTAAEAGACVSRLYERPANAEAEATRRGALAETILSEQTAPDVSTPQPVPPIAPQPATNGSAQPEIPTMGAALALLPLIAQFIPQIASLIKPGSVSTAKDAAVAQTVLNAVVQAAGTGTTGTATTVGAAVDKMAADPALAAAVQKAVVTHPDVIGMLEVGGGVQTARASALAVQVAERPFWYNPLFWISVLFMPAIDYIVFATMASGATGAPWWAGANLEPQTRGTVIGTIVGMIIGGVTSVWFGTMAQSSKNSTTTTTPTSSTATTSTN